MRRRLIAAALLLVAVGSGLCVHLLLPDTASSDIAGDALYALAVYLFIVIVAPRVVAPVVGVIALAWCIVIELFQLTGMPERLGASFAPAMLVLGTVFDPRDLLVAVVTVAVTTAVDAVTGRVTGARSPQMHRRRPGPP